MFEAKWKEKEAALTATYQAQREAELVSQGNFSSQRVHSSCGSTQLPEVDADSIFDMDHISEDVRPYLGKRWLLVRFIQGI